MRNKIVVGPAEYEAIFARCAKVGQTLTTRPPDVSSVRAGIAAALNELVEVGVDDGDGVLKGNYDHGGTFVCDRAPKGIPAIFWTCSYCDFHIALLPGGEPGGACPRCAGRLCWAPKPPGWRPPAPDTTGRIARDRHRRSGWFKPGWKYARVVGLQLLARGRRLLLPGWRCAGCAHSPVQACEGKMHILPGWRCSGCNQPVGLFEKPSYPGKFVLVCSGDQPITCFVQGKVCERTPEKGAAPHQADPVRDPPGEKEEGA